MRWFIVWLPFMIFVAAIVAALVKAACTPIISKAQRIALNNEIIYCLDGLVSDSQKYVMERNCNRLNRKGELIADHFGFTAKSKS
ncbi:hypothetical protein [Vibrio parahaemolyticus]|uniref:hypothetical protein n=1 Tax=Vibrio parahaemolyticus TaxID=670 RepID=UPI003D8135EF